MPITLHPDLTDIVDLHRIGVIQSSDPGAIGAGKVWIDSDDDAFRIRNSADSGWIGPFALASALATYATIASPDLTGTPTAPTAAGGTNTTQIATTAFVQAAITALINAAPGALDTLDELAAALGDDANFASTVTTALAAKAPLASPTLTGTPTAPTPTLGDDSTKIATTAFVQDTVAAGSLPPGGTTGQVLTKQSAADGDADWEDPSGGGSPGTGSTLSITTDLSFWYKASNATLTGPRATALPDDAASAGGVTLTQATAFRQPFYNRNAYNNQPALAFNSHAYLLAASSPLTATDNWTIFVVVRPFITNNDSSVRVILANGTADSNGYVITANRDPNDNAHLISVLYPGVAWVYSDSAYYVGVPQIVCAERDSGTLRIYHNGRLTGNTYTNTPVTPTAFGIGWDSSSRKVYIGEFFEACGYNAALNSTDRGTVTADLGSAYNIPVE